MRRFCLLALCLIFPVAHLRAEDRPNFILVVGDDISYDDVSVNGHPTIATPTLDRMASEGIVFDNVYLAASSCSPSRCSILTGRYPHNTGAPELHQGMGPEQILFTTKLRDAGYYTASSGKNHLYEAAQRGFDLVDTKNVGPGGEDHWVSILKDRPKDRPFFLFAVAWDAHREWQETEGTRKYSTDEVVVPPYMLDTPKTREDLASYYHEISRLDGFVGALLAELEQQGIADNTYVIFMADNGRPFPRAKTRCYDSGMKTPFIAWKGKTLPRSRCGALLSAIDIAPTVLELAKVKTPPTVQGASFAKLFSNTNDSVRDYAFAEHNWHTYPAHERMVRFGRYMYIRNARPELPAQAAESDDTFPAGAEAYLAMLAGKLDAYQSDQFLTPRPKEEFFDVVADPQQFNNLVNEPAYQKEIEHLRRVMDQWRDETGDTAPETLSKYDTPNGMLKTPGEPERAKNTRIIRGETPGDSRDAKNINAPGPIRKP